MSHLKPGELSALVDGVLKGEALWRAQQHLEKCAECRDAMAALSDQDAALATSLRHDPGEAYFADFADRVIGRIAKAEAGGEAPAPDADAGAALKDALRAPFALPWWQRPRALAFASAVTAVVAGAGIVLMMGRENLRPLASRDESPARRSAQVAPPPKDERTSPLGEKEKQAEVTRRDEAAPGSAGAPEAEALPATPPAGARVPVPEVAAPPSAPEPAAAQAPTREAAGARMSEVPRSSAGESRATSATGFATPPPAGLEKSKPQETLRQLKRAAIGPATQKAAEPAALEAPAPDAKVGKAADAPALEKPAANAASAPAADKLASAAEDSRRDAALRRVCGIVRDDSGRPLAGVSVSAIQSARAATTGDDGRFCMDLPAGEQPLRILAVGFQAGALTVPAEGEPFDLVATLRATPVLDAGGAVAARGRLADTSRQLVSARPASPPATAVAPAESRISRGAAGLAAFPDSLHAEAEAAARAQARAESQGSASGLDAAAQAWERLLARAGDGGSELEARARIAECRLGAWQKSKDSRRSARAIEALTAFVVRAPAGDRRGLAARWIDQIRGR